MWFIPRYSLIVLLALPLTAERLVLVDETLPVSTQKPEQVRLTVRKRPLILEARFQGKDSADRLRGLVLTGWGANLLLQGKSYDTLASTEPAASGELRVALNEPGEYAFILLGQSAAVALTIAEVFTPAPAGPQGASPTTIAIVVVLSAAFLAAMYAWAGRKLLRAWRERQSLR